MEIPLLLINSAATFYLLGLIWMTQLCQYPSFLCFRDEDFPRNHDKYRVGAALAATVPMVLEAASAGLLLIYRPEVVRPWEAWSGAAAVLLVWGSTFFLQVPLHEKLSAGYDASAVRRLSATNWVRTAGWTFRAFLAGVWMWRALGA